MCGVSWDKIKSLEKRRCQKIGRKLGKGSPPSECLRKVSPKPGHFITLQNQMRFWPQEGIATSDHERDINFPHNTMGASSSYATCEGHVPPSEDSTTFQFWLSPRDESGLPHEKGTERSKLQRRGSSCDPTRNMQIPVLEAPRRATNDSNCGRYDTNPLPPGLNDYRAPSRGRRQT